MNRPKGATPSKDCVAMVNGGRPYLPLPGSGEHPLGNGNGDNEPPSTLRSLAACGDIEQLCTCPAGPACIPHWKRLLDLTCIFLTFPIWLGVMALVSLWILLVSPGPLLFRQERIGYLGRRFLILKFRTMKINAETQVHEGYFEGLMQADCPMTKLDRGDVRLIRGGRPIRALGLDELPQLFNVLRGEMSIVGPRPCTPHEFERYRRAQRERVNAPPGLTGFWQVNGKNKTTFSQMIEMDLYYAKNMSLRMDLAVILRTLPAIATQVLESRTVRSKRSSLKMFLNEYFFRWRRKSSRGKRIS